MNEVNQEYVQPQGTSHAQTAPVVVRKSKLAAGILGILLGCLGVHNFYLGNNGKAVVQLLITMLSFGSLAVVSAVWGLIEGILILLSQPGERWHKDRLGNELKD